MGKNYMRGKNLFFPACHNIMIMPFGSREFIRLVFLSQWVCELLSYPPIGWENVAPNRRKSWTTELRIPFVSLFFFSAFSTKSMFLFRKLRTMKESYTTADLGHPISPGITYRIWYQCIRGFIRVNCYPFDRD